MASSIVQFIVKKLKENVPLSDIKKDLREKGYDIEMINKAVREAIAGVDKKLPTLTIVQLSILVVGVVIAIGVAIYFTNGKGGGEVQTITQYSEFCNYPIVENEISCEDAIAAALERYKGVVYDVKLGVSEIRVSNGSFEPKGTWILKIKLSEAIELPRIGGADNLEVFVDRIDGDILKVNVL